MEINKLLEVQMDEARKKIAEAEEGRVQATKALDIHSNNLLYWRGRLEALSALIITANDEEAKRSNEQSSESGVQEEAAAEKPKRTRRSRAKKAE